MTSKASAKDYGLIREPVITEKSSLIGSSGNTVVFKVPTSATKTEVKRAVENVFNVKVDGVRTLNMMGKLKRTTSAIGRRAAFKKAYVRLKDGHSIDLLSGV